jgi:oxygen-independent coproporphyrinogen-3 oxidase
VLLSAAGFEHYEVSNYARPGRRARHNGAYWTGAPYVGIGPAAHGFDGETRRWNARGYAEWRDRATSGADPLEGSERLTDENRIAETVYLGLRSESGLVVHDSDEPAISAWRDAGWVTITADRRMRCTPEGWLRLDSLAAALTHHRSR